MNDWVGKVINWKLCKRLKFDHTNKWYLHKQEYVIDNETHKILWEFEILTDHPIRARKPSPVLINKKKTTFNLVDFAVPADNSAKNKRKRKDR